MLSPSPESAGFLCGLVGSGIQASRSPWLHQREADALGVRLIYSLYDLASDENDSYALSSLLKAAQKTHFAGLNITHPFKQRVIPLLDELRPEALRLGAVNTVVFRNGKTIGYNTDYLGFAESLSRGLAGADFANVLQLGAGGAGAATAYALLEHGAGTLHIHDPNGVQADALATRLRQTFEPTRIKIVQDVKTAASQSAGVVNATPLGMTGHPGTPIPTDWLNSSQWVADVIYFPLQTELLRRAKALGCQTINGVEMVVFQAAAAFDLFTGAQADRERMLAAAIENWQD